MNRAPMITTLLPKPSTSLKRVKVFQKACLIFNPVAGKGDANEVLKTIKSLLEPHLQLEVRLTTLEVGPDILAKDAIAQGTEILIAAGGDLLKCYISCTKLDKIMNS